MGGIPVQRNKIVLRIVLRDVTSKKFLARKMWCKQEEASTIALEMMRIKVSIELLIILVTASAHLMVKKTVILDNNFKNLCLTRSLIDLLCFILKEIVPRSFPITLCRNC